jgi:hypothetical protein
VQSVTGTQIVSIGADFYQQGSSVLTPAIYFTLNDLPQVTTFTSLFDQYRIDQVEISFIPMAEITMTPQSVFTAAGTFNQPANPATQAAGLYGTVVDFDDAAALANISAYMEYSNWQPGQVASLKTHTRKFRPHVAYNVYGAGAFGAFGNQTTPWVDCSSPAVQHYGVKFYADKQFNSGAADGSTAQVYPQTWRIIGKYWLSFRNVR